jgi:2-methylcitrate dehydratase PrpD
MSDLTEPDVREVLLRASRVQPTPGGVQRAKEAIGDGLSVALAGALEPVSVQVRRALAEVEGPGNAEIWGTGQRAAPGAAAFANAVAAHALYWDDYTHPMFGHCTAVLLPVCSVLADQSEASGADIVAAYLAGYEVNGLLGTLLGPTHYERGWHPTSTIGIIGSSVAAARLLGLDPHQTWNAMGLAASAAAGFKGNFGSTAKPMHAGHAARAGIVAAQLARQGITANPNWLLGRAGYLAVMGVEDPHAHTGALARDGRDQLVIEGSWGLVLKPYCCCGSGQPMIRAITEAVTHEAIDATDITEIEVHVDPAVTNLLVYERPGTPHQARYCLPYLAAIAAVDRAAGPDQFTATSITRKTLLSMMSRVRHKSDLISPPDARYRAEVRIQTTRGTVEWAADVARGHPSAPMTDTARREKFEQGAGTALTSSGTQNLHDMLESLETIPHWSTVTSLISGSLRADGGTTSIREGH